ncbi:MAG: hypothetical protein MUF15_25965, partial [Acidobacteria bacterium]|nr:hypothetical protein [Acidobacteriota bacterium]
MEPSFKPPQTLKKVIIPFSEANLRLINIIANLHSNLFQAIAYFNYNHFEIELWLEAVDEMEYSPGKLLETLEKETVDKIFVQCLALWNMTKALEFDFIDFKHFELLPESFTDGQSYFSVKFHIRLPVNQTSENENEKNTELKHLLACFQKNKYLSGLNEENYVEKFNLLKEKYIFSRQQAYVYRYGEFASALLNAYPIDELKNEINIKIKIKTIDPVQKKIIKRHLYRDYVAEEIFFIDVDNHWPQGSLPQYIFELVSEAVEKNSPALNDNTPHPGNDPISIIQFLDLFLRKSAFKYFVLIIDQLKSKEDAEFINYLVHSSGISHIVLIIFDSPAQVSVSSSLDFLEFDLELNETPPNLLENYLHFDDIPVSTPLNSDNEGDFIHDYLEKADVHGKIPTAEVLNARLKYAVKTHRVKELNELLKKYLLALHKDDGDNEKDEEWSERVKMDFTGNKIFLVENLEFLEKDTVNPPDFVETLRFLVEILIGEGDWALAVSLIRGYMAKDPVFLKLKLAHFYYVEKDHPRMHTLLEEIKGDHYEPWSDEFYYLNYLYYEKILNIKNADLYFKKIKNPLFLHLANIKLSDRYIYQGNFDR